MKLFRAGTTAFACFLLLSACEKGAEVEDEQSVEDETPAVPVEPVLRYVATYTQRTQAPRPLRPSQKPMSLPK